MQVLPVIMAGGSGTRLWPLSRVQYPKQFLPLASDGESLLQATIKRLEGLTTTHPLLICNNDHRFLAAEQLRLIEKPETRILLEPEGRNTAPAAALAAVYAMRNGEDPLLLLMAADHVIGDSAAFCDAIHQGVPLAQNGRLVTFGIVPLHPETAYGYIEKGKSIGSGFTIERFIEKPNLEDASEYFSTGNFLWNSGIFLFKASRYLEELEIYAPQILKICKEAVQNPKDDGIFIAIDKEIFKSSPADSIDYAVMEKTTESAVIPMDAQWNDVGSWSALWDISPKDANGNVKNGDVITYNSHNSYVYADSRLVTLVGMSDVVVVETKDALLVVKRSDVQDVKKIASTLRDAGRSEHFMHREVFRPWGAYDSIDNGKRYQVKRITVKPGAKLSVQMHHHRAEHWIVVSGTAKITNGEKTYLLTENQSTYIPVGEIHALENPGRIPLELIEVQSGAYLGEDDIVRIEDRYGRV